MRSDGARARAGAKVAQPRRDARRHSCMPIAPGTSRDPGRNFVSYLRGGFWGAWAGGWAFILPNFVIVAALGALYVYLGDLQPVTAIFYGVSPAVIALILHSCYRLAKLGMEDWLQWCIAGACFLVTVILQSEVALLFIGAGTVGVLYYGTPWRRPPTTTTLLVAVPG